MQKFDIFIPARVGSQGVPNKNFRKFHRNDCLVDLAVRFAVQLSGIYGSKVIISTDNSDFLPPVSGQNVRMLDRPPRLSQSDSSQIDLYKYYLSLGQLDPSRRLLILQPTSPLRTKGFFDQFMSQCGSKTGNWCSAQLLSVGSHEVFQIDTQGNPAWISPKANNGNRQNVDNPELYVEDGMFYFFDLNHLDDRCEPVIIDGCFMVDIDTWNDWRLARLLYANLKPL